MGKGVCIPACLERLFSCFLKSGNTSAVSILICAVWFAPIAIAQVNQESGSDIQTSPNFTVFFSSEPKADGTASMLVRRYVRDNIKLPIDRIRFLAIEDVSAELQLSESETAKFKDLFELLEGFEQADKWNFYAPVDEVKQKAEANVRDFIAELKRIDSNRLLTDSQIRRLEQLRLRFNCLGVNFPSSAKSPIEKVKRQLNLTQLQLAAIREAIGRELGTELLLEAQFDEIRSILNEDQVRQFDAIFDFCKNQEVPAALALAQCKDHLPLPKFESVDPPDFDLELCDLMVLTPSGRLATETGFLEGADGVYTTRIWRQILDQILDGGMEWLELVDSQTSEIKMLRQDRARENGDTYRYYFGMEAFSNMKDRPSKDWPAESY